VVIGESRNVVIGESQAHISWAAPMPEELTMTQAPVARDLQPLLRDRGLPSQSSYTACREVSDVPMPRGAGAGRD